MRPRKPNLEPGLSRGDLRPHLLYAALQLVLVAELVTAFALLKLLLVQLVAKLPEGGVLALSVPNEIILLPIACLPVGTAVSGTWII